LAVIQNLEGGEALTDRSKHGSVLLVRASATVLDMDDARRSAEQVLDHGVTAEQLHETLVRVFRARRAHPYGGSRTVVQLLRERQDPAIAQPPDERQQEIWTLASAIRRTGNISRAKFVGSSNHYSGLSPAAFETFLEYFALP
jgi:hypothetical protein